PSSLIPPTPSSTLFPYTTLFRSVRGSEHPHRARDRRRAALHPAARRLQTDAEGRLGGRAAPVSSARSAGGRSGSLRRRRSGDLQDRKSTRLNSSHEWISYAVFCL